MDKADEIELGDHDYVLTEGGAWFTIGKWAVRIHLNNNSRLTCAIYKDGEEDNDPIAECSVYEYNEGK